MATIEQWVNLEAEDKWLGDGATSLRRLGRSVRVDIKFSKAARHVFYLSVEPDGENAPPDPMTL